MNECRSNNERLYLNELINERRQKQPYVRTQLAIATSASKAEINIIRLVTELINERRRKPSSSVEYCVRERINIIQLVMVLINCTDRPQKLYVRTQLAIATMKESKNKLICGSDKKANTQLAIANVTELIRDGYRRGLDNVGIFLKIAHRLVS